MWLLHTQIWQAPNLAFTTMISLVWTASVMVPKKKSALLTYRKLEEGDCPSGKNLQGFFPCGSEILLGVVLLGVDGTAMSWSA